MLLCLYQSKGGFFIFYFYFILFFFTFNLTQGVFFDRIYRINHTETWNFNAPTLVTSVSHKITAKCGILCPKTLLLTEKQLHASPLAIPKSCAQNMSIRLVENHSFQVTETLSFFWNCFRSLRVFLKFYKCVHYEQYGPLEGRSVKMSAQKILKGIEA